MGFADYAEIDGNLAVIRGALGPSSFFKNLRSIENEDRTVFLNDAGEVQVFPDRMTVTLMIMGPWPKGRDRINSTGFDAAYMEELKFKAYWKRGVEQRPVKSLRLLTASETQSSDFRPLFSVKECWIYEFVVEDNEVPVSDHLIFYIISPAGKRLARISAHL